MNNHCSRFRAKGYTLIEIMIALAVFAILGAIASGAIYQAFETRSRVSTQANQLNDLQLAILRLTRDVHQMVVRSVFGDEMHIFPPFVGQPNYLEFTRAGLVNPGDIANRSTLQRVAWLCQKDQLIRRSFTTLDSLKRHDYQDTVVLGHLKSCSFAYLTNKHQRLSEWREFTVLHNQSKERLPIAVQGIFTFEQWGNMSLLFIIPGGLYA